MTRKTYGTFHWVDTFSTGTTVSRNLTNGQYTVSMYIDRRGEFVTVSAEEISVAYAIIREQCTEYNNMVDNARDWLAGYFEGMTCPRGYYKDLADAEILNKMQFHNREWNGNNWFDASGAWEAQLKNIATNHDIKAEDIPSDWLYSPSEDLPF